MDLDRVPVAGPDGVAGRVETSEVSQRFRDSQGVGRWAGLDLPASRLAWSDHDVVLGQRFRAFQAGFARLHFLRGKANPIRVFAVQSLQSRMLATPGHPQSLLHDYLQAIQ